MSNPTLYQVPAWHSAFTRVDWRDGDAVHKRIMRLFPPHLAQPDTAPGGARAAANILFRPELHRPAPVVLVQADVAAIDMSFRRAPLKPLLDALSVGRTVNYRVDINAVRMRSRTRRLEPVPLPDIQQWARTTRLSAGLDVHHIGPVSDVEVRRGKNGTPIRIVRLEGQATVTDTVAACDTIRSGVGRARSYGCGLLSIAPV